MRNRLRIWTLRAWLALWLQDRRRGRQIVLLPAPVLVAQYPSLAAWTWSYANPDRWNAYNSLDGGLTFQFDDWVTGSARQYAPDGGQHWMFIVGVDVNGRELTQRSNAVRPDDAPAEPNAPTMTGSSVTWDATQANWADITLSFTFVHGTYPLANLEIWKSLNGGGYVLLATVASTATGYYYALACAVGGGTFDFKARYKNGGTLGPYSNVLRVDVTPV